MNEVLMLVDDIPLLVQFFIEKYNKEFDKQVKGINDVALRILMDYGNTKQLRATVERAVLMTENEVISIDDIKGTFTTNNGIFKIEIPDDGINFEEIEKELIKKAMAKANNVATQAAKLLGMSYKTFWYRLEKLGLNTGKGQLSW